MTRLAVLFDAQTRTDIGAARPGDHDCAQRLEVLLQEAAERIAARLEAQRQALLDRQHDAICDGGDGCTHYESPEEG